MLYKHMFVNQLLNFYHVFVFFLLFGLYNYSRALVISSKSTSSHIVRRSVNLQDDNDIEKCYFHISNQSRSTDITIFYGECMSMNGPDGCCLEGHYKPGICSNLGHICCTNPDPECETMFSSKELYKLVFKQYGHVFMQMNQDIEQQNRAIRSNPPEKLYKYRTNFEIVEMPAHMHLDAVAFAINGLDRYNGDFDDAAEFLCRILDQKYKEPRSWACTIGRDFGYSVEPAPGKYMMFYIGREVRVMAFVSNNN